MNKTAIVIGATGLVGSHLVRLLLENNDYDIIKVFGRRRLEMENPKLKEFVVDFDDPSSFEKDITGDVLYSSLGTTIRQAGSKDAQYKVDYTYQLEVAKAAADNGVKSYVLVSSAGANPNARFFYMRMKGELDETVKSLSFRDIAIIRPSTLLGERDERRAGEKVAIKVTHFFTRLIPGLKKYRPIHAHIVANAMVNAAGRKKLPHYQVFAYQDVFDLAMHQE